MTQTKQIYKCLVCGNIVEVLHQGVGELVCCNQPMKMITSETKDGDQEKHLPVIEELPANVCSDKDGFKVKIGETEHPMEENHYIEWIEINVDNQKSGKRFFKPGDKPETIFETRSKVESVRAYCNVHGLWTLQLK